MLKEKKYGIWFPEYCLVRTDIGWSFPEEIGLNKFLLYFDEKVKYKKPTIRDKVFFKGYLIGSNKTLFKQSDNVINDKDDFFTINEISNTIYKETSIQYYEGFLYRYDFTPILSYEYKISKLNKINILNLEYKI